MSTEYSPSPKPDSGSDEFHRVLGEYLARAERDGTVALDEFRHRHPEFADRLGRQLDWLAAHLGRKEDLPERIGPYRVIHRLGAGGMGEVYLAEQSAPFLRTVAIKVIRSDRISEGRVARFLQEIQALASLNHDGIAKVFEAGEDGGRPYFTMEYVPGRPVTDYCAEERLGLRARLRLFLRVCSAVEHAHRHGILHRDLKPSNILVSGKAGEATVKIIDFGLAKIVAPEAAGAQRTLTGQVLGTPDYMSPEQVDESSEHHVDTRTDVYSLGVVLYELLTGVLPLSLWQMDREDFRAMLRAIRERKPSSPSVRVEEVAAVPPSSPATGDGISSHRLSKLLAGDLDAIVMKALAKNAADRYGSVTELAQDVQRHLHHEPVGARTATRRYLLAKFVRRHRFGVAFATVLTLVVVCSLVAINVLAQQNIRNLEHASLFADAKYLETLRDSDKLPKPARPEHVAALTDLLAEFERLTAERPRWRAFTALPVAASADRTGRFGGATAGAVLRATLRHAITVVDKLTAPRAELDKLRLRIAFAKTVQAATVDAHSSAWVRARAQVRADQRYGQLDLPPQPGLVPLGPDPVLGWQEFALLLPGADLPRRTGERWEMGPRTCPVFVLLPGGTVTIGAQADDPDAPNYDPARQPTEPDPLAVEVGPFFASKYEFSYGQWRLLSPGPDTSSDDHDFLFSDDVQPLVNRDLHSMLHVLMAWGMRFPTAVEWEYLARAGTGTPYCCGAKAQTLAGNANVHDQSVDERGDVRAEGNPAPWSDGHPMTAPIGSFAPNAFGLHDVHGNANEVAVLDEDQETGLVLEFRGGSWHQAAEAARITATVQWDGSPLPSLGVRPVIHVVLPPK